MKIQTIGVIGHTGTVGGAVYRYFRERGGAGVKTYGYSLEDTKYKEETNRADVIFVCVPTPYEGYHNAGIVDQAISQIDFSQAVVIKSTVDIGTTDYLQDKYKQLDILFNPEFLSDATAWEDFINPDRQIVGYTAQSYQKAIDVLHLLPESPYDTIVLAKEAELLKYINNVHGYLEVIESNIYYDICQREGLDYDKVIKAAVASKWVGCPMGRHYRTIWHKGYRGVGGKCFPKDMAAFIDYTDRVGIENGIFKSAVKYNKKLTKGQNCANLKSRESPDKEPAG